MIQRKNRTIPAKTQHLNKVAIFVEVARAGSFVAAADRLSLSRSTVSDHIRHLEEALDVRLLDRSTRTLRLTDEGRLLLEHMRPALAAWEDAQAALDRRRSEPTGHLRLSAPAGLVSTLLAPALASVMGEHVTAEVIIEDRVCDLLKENIDLAIRMAPLHDSRLIARKIGTTQRRVIVAPHLNYEASPPLETLSEANWIGHSAVTSPEIHLYREGESSVHKMRPRFRAHASTSEGQRALVAQGLGLASIPWVLVREDVRAGTLGAVPGWRGGDLGVYAIYPASGRMPARTRLLLDALVEAC